VTKVATVHVVVPDGIDDPLRPSGGNTYDRRLRDGLQASGWSVRTRAVAGAWPRADEPALRSLRRTLGALPDGSLVLLDGLVASAAAEVVVPESRRLRLVVLMHMPLGCTLDHDDVWVGECEVLGAAAAVVTTSHWSRDRLLATYRLDAARVHVAQPGVDAADAALGSPTGGNLLCVAAVIPGKGHDLLVRALARVADQTWRCTCVGDLTRAPDFVADLRRSIAEAGLEERITLTGARAGDDLAGSYGRADLLVLASRAETYGMVVTEALARALPVLATDVGGISEALGTTAGGRRPGVLTTPGDVGALAGALRSWLRDAALRRDLREAARERRSDLTGWKKTATRVARVLMEASS
jgi:glycosyltransferase involved in cell wall biosynthesis